MENNIKIALIEHRTGLLDQIPESLNQSEIGFAYDANRLFIGNSNNNELALRTTFPYQNVEILTEFSELHNYIKYRYVNNFENVNGETSREKLIERVPFVISCDTYQIPENDYSLTINGVSFAIQSGMTIVEFAELINAQYEATKTSVFVNSKNHTSLIFVCTNEYLEISADAEVIDLLGLPSEIDEIAKELPERKMTEKLDDMVHITDFGIKPSSGTDVSEDIMKSCVGIYNKFEDTQTHRRIFFPAGKYLFNDEFDSFYSLPLLSGMTIYGEGANNTVFEYTPAFVNYSAQIMNKSNQYATDDTYVPEIISDIYVHDISFSSDGGFGSVYLRNAKNITFENVIFKGNGNLITITGDSSELVSTNIKFINCVFIGGTNQVYIEKNTSNILFDGCRFENPNNLYVKIGDNNSSDANITKVIFDNNVFTGLDYGLYVNYVAGQSKYVSFTNSQFDDFVVERQENHPIPFNNDFDYSGRNYTDTLNATTDTRKVLRFKFTQPKWDYLNQLIDSDGILTFNVRRDQPLELSEHAFVDLQVSDTNATLSVQGESEEVNFNISNTKGNIEILSSDEMKLSSDSLNIVTQSDISVSSTGTIDIASAGQTSVTSTESITLTSADEINLAAPTNFGGTIDLQNSNITNSMENDINFVTNNGQLVTITDINPPEGTTYADRAIVNENAIATSAMLQRFQSTVHGFASYQNITSAGNISLYDCSQYQSDNFVLKELDVNFINPPEYVCVDCNDGFPYIFGYTYPKNTILYLNGKQYVVMEDFTASISTDVSVDAIGGYLVSEQPFYDNSGATIVPSEISYKTVHFVNGHVGYQIVVTSTQEKANRSKLDDYELDGHQYTAFTDSNNELVFIKDYNEYQCSYNDLISMIYEEVIDSDEPLKIFDPDKQINKFDIILISNNDDLTQSYYVLGRVENVDETYSLVCYPSDNKATEGRVMPYEYTRQYCSNEMLSYQGNRYQCINDDRYENINMTGYKIVQNGTNLYQYAYRGSDGVIYADGMDTDFTNYHVYNDDGTQATTEDTDSFHAALNAIIIAGDIETIFNGTSTEFRSVADPDIDYVFKDEFYKNSDELFARILNPEKFKHIGIKGSSYNFTGGLGLYETSGEKQSDVVKSVILEELNLKNCVIAVRFFNKNGEHIAEFSNSDPLESLKIGFFIEGVR